MHFIVKKENKEIKIHHIISVPCNTVKRNNYFLIFRKSDFLVCSMTCHNFSFCMESCSSNNTFLKLFVVMVCESEEWSSQLIFQFKQLERRSLKKSGLQRDSNPWPPRYRCDALPTELWSYTLGARSINWVHIFQWGVKWCEVYMK